MGKPTTCPRCHVRCTAGELRSAIHQRARPMIAPANNGPLREYRDGAVLAAGETVVWPIRESRKAVCSACTEELRRGPRAYRSVNRKGWRSA